MNLSTTFVAGSVVLDVVARSMKKSGVAVFLRQKNGKAKAVLGMRQIFLPEQESEAKAAYEALVAATVAKGWTKGVSKVKTAGASRFNEIPEPPAAEETEAPAAVPAAQDAAPTGGKKGGKK